MMTSSQARNMAEMKWGRGGTRSRRTNRKGAFYFSCSGHGGFVIDGRCLTQDERTNIIRYIEPEIAHAVVRNDGKVKRLRGPDSQQTLRYSMAREHIEEIEVFFAEEDCAWAIPAVIAGILDGDTTRQQAVACFLRHQKPSNHECISLGLNQVSPC